MACLQLQHHCTYGVCATLMLLVWEDTIVLKVDLAPLVDLKQSLQASRSFGKKLCSNSCIARFPQPGCHVCLQDVLRRAERWAGQRLGPAATQPMAAAFGFQVEDRVQCSESGRVSYRRTPQNVLALDIDPEAATNKDELEEYKVNLRLIVIVVNINFVIVSRLSKPHKA
jgi:hypothetical protein